MDDSENRTHRVEDGGEGLVRRAVNGGRAEEVVGSNPADSQDNSCNDDKHETSNENEANSIERVFDSKNVPPWWEQITLRALLVSLLLGIMLSIIVMKLNLTTGVIPSLNVSAGLLGFFLIRTWTKLMEKSGLLKTPFTRQENTVIQTCTVACYGIAFSGGFGSYLLGMNSNTYKLSGVDTPGNTMDSIKNPSLGWIIGFLFAVSFLGLFALVPLRKIMVIDYKLTYPSGTATAWFFTSIPEECGFANFPTFGLKAYEQRFYFDFSMTYVGAGMICPHLVNLSLLFGAVLSWGLMWPLIKNRKGDWFSAELSDSSMAGDGLYNFVKILFITLRAIYRQWKMPERVIPVTINAGTETPLSYDEERRNQMFMKDSIPMWVAACGYVALAAISIGVVPKIFHEIKWYYVLLAYIVAPILGFCNAYGAGLTDWSLASTYGKLALFIFSAWAGKDNGGVIAGLAACGVMMSIVSTASDLMQDFKTGYLTLSSPRSMFVSQVIGTAMGCIVAPLTFWLFYKAFPVGDQSGEYKAPNALIYRNMAIIGVEGFQALPQNCLNICYGLFVFAVITDIIRDLVPKKVSQFIPLPMAMAIPFYLGAYFAIDMCVGTAIVFAWQRINRKKADLFVPAVASGLICGDGIWTLPSSILALAKVKPPICMKFLSRQANDRVDVFLGI
eukprot:Gb_41263 [translate_table: standard]